MECPGDFARCSGHTCTRLICSVRFDGGFFVFVTVVFAIVVLVVVVVVIAGGGCRNAHKPRASRHPSLRPNALAAAARLPVDCQLDKILCLCSSSFCAAMRCSFRELLCYRKFETLQDVFEVLHERPMSAGRKPFSPFNMHRSFVESYSTAFLGQTF